MYPPPLNKRDHERASERAWRSNIAVQEERAALQHARRRALEVARDIQIAELARRAKDEDMKSVQGRRSSSKNKRKFFPKRKSSCKKRKMVWKKSSNKCNLRK